MRGHGTHAYPPARLVLAHTRSRRLKKEIKVVASALEQGRLIEARLHTNAFFKQLQVCSVDVLYAPRKNPPARARARAWSTGKPILRLNCACRCARRRASSRPMVASSPSRTPSGALRNQVRHVHVCLQKGFQPRELARACPPLVGAVIKVGR